MQSNIFSVSVDNKYNLNLLKNDPIRWVHPSYTKFLVFLQSGCRIITSKKREIKLTGNEETIIHKIHHLRYADTNSYVTTGGHFSQLYVRNLGIFLNALLDTRIPSSENDWMQRQSIALRTVALDLEVFSKAKKSYTTIVPIWKNFYSAMNIYTEPSDALFGIVFTLCALIDETCIPSLFPASIVKQRKLQTINAAKQLIKDYQLSLTALISDYRNYVLDSKTGLIKRHICLASARDGIKRQSSFYDNVILWATSKLAKQLGLISISEKELLAWKKKIITSFWNEEEGIFLDDLSKESKQEKRFSADSFIVTSSGFLDLKNNDDLKKLMSMVKYVQKNELDKPFPLRYSKTNQTDKLYWPVKLGAPEYMGTTIWSHWGMEYIKALLLVGKKTDAQKHIAAYTENIEKYGGYPELYDMRGNVYTTFFYRGVLHNSWIINYEQAKMLLTL